MEEGERSGGVRKRYCMGNGGEGWKGKRAERKKGSREGKGIGSASFLFELSYGK